jgi:hypothetical protein
MIGTLILVLVILGVTGVLLWGIGRYCSLTPKGQFVVWTVAVLILATVFLSLFGRMVRHG